MLRLRSGCLFTISKETVGRVGIERCQPRIEAEPRPAVGTEDRVGFGHIDVDMRVVLRWGFRRDLCWNLIGGLRSDEDTWSGSKRQSGCRRVSGSDSAIRPLCA